MMVVMVVIVMVVIVMVVIVTNGLTQNVVCLGEVYVSLVKIVPVIFVAETSILCQHRARW